jgi:hypothetical protein
LHSARRHTHRTPRAYGHALNRALDNAAPAFFGDDALGTLDVTQTGFRIDRDQLAVDVGGVIRDGGVHRLGHAHRAALQ